MTSKTKKSKKSPDYVGFGHVEFPYKSTGWRDAALGVCTVRVLAVNLFKPPTESSLATFGDISFDDVLIGTDIHDTPEAAFNFIQDNKNCIDASELLGHINWVGIGVIEDLHEFWACTYDDLDATGKQTYDHFKNTHMGSQVLIITSICRDKETITHLTEETEKRGLPKLTCVI